MSKLITMTKKFTENFMRIIDIENIEMLVVTNGVKVSYLGNINNTPVKVLYNLEDKENYTKMTLSLLTEKTTILNTTFNIVSDKDLNAICVGVKAKLPRNNVKLKQEVLVFTELTNLEDINLICMSQQFIRIMFLPNNMVQSIDLLISNDIIHVQVQTIRKVWDLERSYPITEIDKLVNNIKGFYQYALS